MDITSKYDVGDKIWYGDAVHVPVYDKCPDCSEGRISVLINKRVLHLHCPTCRGTGGIERFIWRTTVKQRIVKEIRFNSEEPEIRYICVKASNLKKPTEYVDESRLHKTKEDAQAYAESLVRRLK